MLTPAPNRMLAALFLLLALPLGLFMACVVPLGQVPDEWDHAERADSLLHGELLGSRRIVPGPNGAPVPSPSGGLMADPGLLAATHGMNDPRTMNGAELLAKRAVPWYGVFYMEIGSAAYWPVSYLPAAAAIGAVKALGGGPFQALLAARLANLAVFVLAGAAGLLLARRGQALMFCALMLPMTLNLAASVNPDGLMIASCVLAVALLSRAAPRGAAYWGAAALLANVAMLKPPYAPLAALLLLPLPPVAEWRARRRALAGRAGVAALVVLAAFIWGGVASSQAGTVRFFHQPYAVGPLFPTPSPAPLHYASPAMQAKVLWADPLRVVSLPVASVQQDAWLLLRNGIGALGWATVILPDWMYTLWEAALVSAILIELLRRRAPADGAMVLESPLLFLSLAASVLGIYLAMYLAGTAVGAELIEGVQGRYWLPLLPLLAMALPRLRPPGGRAAGAALWLLPVAAASANMLMLPRVLVEYYYIP